MKNWSTSRLSAKSKSLFVIIAVGLTIAGRLQGGYKSTSATGVAASSRQAEARRSSAIPTPKLANQPPACPTFGPTLPPTSTPPTGSHIVILSWTASATDSKHSAAAGYCVYRGTDPKTLPNELLNPVAFSLGTKCDDNSVQNGVTYFYVMRAVNLAGVPSVPSTPSVPAPIPNTPGKNSVNSVPLCRQP